MTRTTWTTYRITSGTHQVGTDVRATGGVHLHQVRRTRNGYWHTRIVDSNGRYESPGPARAITITEGEARYASANAQEWRTSHPPGTGRVKRSRL